MSGILETLKFLGSSWLDVAVAVDKRLETQAARIAELEAALRSIVEYCDDPYLPYYKDILSKAHAALEGRKKDE